jgi:CheY-like chemotaxis protein
VNAADQNGDSEEFAAPAQPTILVVEDEVLVRLALVEELRDQGLRVIDAANAEEALQVLGSAEPVDALLTDIQMPGRLDGVGLMRRAKVLRPGIKIAAMSAYERDDPVGQLVDAYFRKPFNFNHMVRRLRALLSD